jgi:hypothetical protein
MPSRQVSRGEDSRSQKRHIRPPNRRIRNLGVECRDRHKHDRAHKRAEHMLHNHQQQIPRRRPSFRECHHYYLGEDRGDQPSNKTQRPDGDGLVLLGPFAGVVAERDFEGEVDQDGQGEVFLAETFVEEFEVRDGVVGLEADFGDQVDEDEDLDVAELEDAAHGLVHLPNAVFFPRSLLALENREAQGDGQVCPAPEGEVGAQCHEAGFLGHGAEVFVGEVGRGEGEEDGVGEEVTGGETDGLGGGGVGEVGGGEEGEGPACEQLACHP